MTSQRIGSIVPTAAPLAVEFALEPPALVDATTGANLRLDPTGRKQYDTLIWARTFLITPGETGSLNRAYQPAGDIDASRVKFMMGCEIEFVEVADDVPSTARATRHQRDADLRGGLLVESAINRDWYIEQGIRLGFGNVASAVANHDSPEAWFIWNAITRGGNPRLLDGAGGPLARIESGLVNITAVDLVSGATGLFQPNMAGTQRRLAWSMGRLSYDAYTLGDGRWQSTAGVMYYRGPSYALPEDLEAPDPAIDAALRQSEGAAYDGYNIAQPDPPASGAGPGKGWWLI